MPALDLKLDGIGGSYADVFQRYPTVHMREDIPIRMETLDHGMTSGKPSVAIILELPQVRGVVLARTSVRLFQMAAFGMLSRYGDLTDGAVMGQFTVGGTANLTLSDAVDCPKCTRSIPSSCHFCPECGAKL